VPEHRVGAASLERPGPTLAKDDVARPAEGTLLEVDDLRTWFETPRGVLRAVDGVSLSLARGRTVGVVGESGSGKSVFARSVMGLLPRNAIRPSGRVTFDGRDVGALKGRAATRFWGVEMAMVFQDPMTALNPVKRVGEQITESIRYHLRVNRRWATTQALELLQQVGIPEPRRRLRQYPHELSGGMRQRIVIAMALACGPKLLVADEPTTALDVTVQKQILDLLADIERERNMAMILITHDLGVVAGRTDEICVMYAGRVVERAPTPTLFAAMRHPYTEALVQSIPRLEHRSHTRLSAISGRPPDLVHPPAGCRFAPRCRYAQDRCIVEDPQLVPSGQPGHEHACFFPVGTPEGEAALARNLSVGHSAAGLPVGDSTALLDVEGTVPVLDGIEV
jgi:peptide/nickel transport system ATP-binding protein